MTSSSLLFCPKQALYTVTPPPVLWLMDVNVNVYKHHEIMFFLEKTRITHMLRVWYIYLQLGDVFHANVGIHIPAPWSIWDIVEYYSQNSH